MEGNKTFTEIIQDWWSFVVFVGTLVVGWLLGSAKTTWTLKHAVDRINKMETEIHDLKSASDLRNVNIAVIKNDVDNIKTTQSEMKLLLLKLIDKEKI